jgi:hypothetical protein
LAAPPAPAADAEECELISRVDSHGTRRVTARCLKTGRGSCGAASDLPRCNETEAKGGWAKFPGETADRRAVRYLDENCKEHKHRVRSASAAPTEETRGLSGVATAEAVARMAAWKATGKAFDDMSDWGQDRYLEEARALLLADRDAAVSRAREEGRRAAIERILRVTRRHAEGLARDGYKGDADTLTFWAAKVERELDGLSSTTETQTGGGK